MDDCVFCKIAKGEVPAEKIYENDNFFSIPDVKPIIKGHSLIISKKHFGPTFLNMPSTLAPELLDCIKKTIVKLMDKYKSEGFNVLNNGFDAGGQIVKHVHFHILPRNKGDGLKLIG